MFPKEKETCGKQVEKDEGRRTKQNYKRRGTTKGKSILALKEDRTEGGGK